MNANLGDVIKWPYKDNDYYARVDAILEDGKYYGVHVVYEEFGLQQDMISPACVLAVYKLECERTNDDRKEF